MLNRTSGVLLHISSLPGNYGIGTFGENGYKFADFLKRAGQSWWQILPLGHTGFGNSPYQCFSAFAGNPYFIDLDMLINDGLLLPDEVSAADFGDNIDFIDYGKLYNERFKLLRLAFSRGQGKYEKEFESFCAENESWLCDYALFMAVKDKFGGAPLWLWSDDDIRARKPSALEKYRKELVDEIEFYKFIQYLFFGQWKKLKEYVNKQGIRIIGDIPFYVAPDSADVWAEPEMFKVDEKLSPKFIAGVPPDYYSETGQLWGNPVYNWKNHAADGFSWWLKRLEMCFKMYDIVRIDHFRGFKTYWEIKAGSATAMDGEWRNGPAESLFDKVKELFGDKRIIAEDLGMLSPDVKRFIKDCGFPGMKVMVFAFDGRNYNNEHLPHCICKNTVAYTSTHDSLPFCAALDTLLPDARAQAVRYIRSAEGRPFGIDAVNTLWASPAIITIAPMQDVLSLGADSTMNRPSVADGNWRWRVRAEAFNDNVAGMLYDATKIYGRLNPHSAI